MLKKLNIILILTIILAVMLESCSDGEDSLTDKYWVKYKRSKPNYLVKFTDDGKFINFNKLAEPIKYHIIQNRIIFTEETGEKEKFFIKTLTSHEMKLSEINDIGEMDIDYFRAAEEEDYLLGSWIKIDKGEG